MAKKYPFSLRKHGHDLEFRRNRAKNEFWEKEDTLSDEEYKRLDTLIERLTEILCYYPDANGLIWLEGKDWSLAHESMIWAESTRANINAEARYNR